MFILSCWVLNQPVFFESTIEVYKDYPGSVVTANLPLKDEEPELLSLVESYQIHSHSLTCKKNKKSCRFHYGYFFPETTVIAKPLQTNSEFEKCQLLKK